MELQTETGVAVDEAVVAAQINEEDNFVHIPVPKGGKGATIKVDLRDLPDETYKEALFYGLKHLVTTGMTKITKSEIADEKTRQAEAMKKAEANLENLKQGKFRRANKTKSTETGAVMTEARRLAKALVKDEMKRKKVKVSLVEASEITRVANILIDNDPTIIAQARANLSAREQTRVSGIGEIVSGIKVSAKKVAKEAEDKARKAKEKEEATAALSATQAGIVAKGRQGVAAQPRR